MNTIKKRLNPKESTYIDVSVATLWSKPGLSRPIDKPSLTNPVHLWEWTQSMTLDEKLWLVGKVETQALFGNQVTIVEIQGDWAQILVHDQLTPRCDRGYPGWIPLIQLVNNPPYDKWKKEPFAVVTKPTAMLYTSADLNQEIIEISFNTRLPLLSTNGNAYGVLLPNGKKAWIKKEDVTSYRSADDIPSPTGGGLVTSAKQFLGLPYLWGGTSGFGFDCSGFVSSVYHFHGLQIPRDSGPQFKAGIPVERDQLQEGDLLFFSNTKGCIVHVTMYAGGSLMIHAPESAKSIELTSIDSPNYVDSYAGARRYL